jgi:hypothetical protein
LTSGANRKLWILQIRFNLSYNIGFENHLGTWDKLRLQILVEKEEKKKKSGIAKRDTSSQGPGTTRVQHTH